MKDMENFITKHPKLCSDIMSTYGLNVEKLEKVVEIMSNKSIPFEPAGCCPHGFYLNVNLKNKIKNIFEFGEFLKNNNFYERDYKIFQKDYYGPNYKIIIDQSKSSEVEIWFNNPEENKTINL